MKREITKKATAYGWVIKATAVFFACKEHPYINHTLKWEKIEGACASGPTGMTMESNIAGERFVFNDCLAKDYHGQCELEQKGDTIRFSLPKSASGNVLYKLTLDIDAWPPYQ